MQKNIFASVATLSMQKKYVKNFDVFKTFCPVAMLSGQKNIFASVATLSMQKKYVKNFDVFFCNYLDGRSSTVVRMLFYSIILVNSA